MTNPAMKLDTLAYAKKLIAAGCTPQLAEAHASVQQDTLLEISEHFATKQDLLMTEQRIEAKITTLEQKIETMGMKLTLKMGGMLVAAVFVLAAISKLHW